MNLSLSFYALLAGVLLALSAQDADAHPIVKRGGSVTLPLKRIQQRSDLHPQIVRLASKFSSSSLTLFPK